MLNQAGRRLARLARKALSLGVLLLCLVTLSTPPAGRQAHADDDCYFACDEQKWACEQNCVYSGGDGTYGAAFARCREACNNAWNSCVARCNGFE
jgi:hypothetical protein